MNHEYIPSATIKTRSGFAIVMPSAKVNSFIMLGVNCDKDSRLLDINELFIDLKDKQFTFTYEFIDKYYNIKDTTTKHNKSLIHLICEYSNITYNIFPYSINNLL